MRVIVAGPPCAGKSSLARKLAAEMDAEVIDFDEIAQQMGSRSHHDHTYAVRLVVSHEIERRLQNLSERAVVIRSAPDPLERRSLAKRIKADRVIVMPVPAEEAKRRAATDERPRWTGAAIDRWWSRYRPHEDDIVVE